MHCCEKRPESNKAGTHVDPVCGMKVNEFKPELAAEYNGRKYYFCAKDCMQEFNRHPERCLNPERTTGAKKKKGIWGRYLDRLNKATGGKPIRCH